MCDRSRLRHENETADSEMVSLADLTPIITNIEIVAGKMPAGHPAHNEPVTRVERVLVAPGHPNEDAPRPRAATGPVSLYAVYADELAKSSETE